MHRPGDPELGRVIRLPDFQRLVGGMDDFRAAHRRVSCLTFPVREAGSSRCWEDWTVLAKLIAYYRPAKFSSAPPDSKSKPVPINFANLSWNPDWDDFPMRLEEIRRFFGAIYQHSQSLGLHNPKPNRDFLKNLVKLTGVSGKPVLTEFSAASTAVNLVRNDLLLSRPVIIVFAYESEVVSLPIRWALIDGINSKGELHVDFPLNSELGDAKPKPGYYPPAALMFKNYKVSIVTSLYYKP